MLVEAEGLLLVVADAKQVMESYNHITGTNVLHLHKECSWNMLFMSGRKGGQHNASLTGFEATSNKMFVFRELTHWALNR